MLANTLLIAQYLREVRVKTAALLAANSFTARTGIFRRQTYTVHRFQTRFALTFIVLSALHTTVSAMVVYERKLIDAKQRALERNKYGELESIFHP